MRGAMLPHAHGISGRVLRSSADPKCVARIDREVSRVAAPSVMHLSSIDAQVRSACSYYSLTSCGYRAWVYSIGSEQSAHRWKRKLEKENGGPENPPS